MSQGRVKWFNKKKRYGFIRSEKGDVFIHYSAFIEHFIPNSNDLLSFDIINSDLGLKAENIKRVKK